MTDYIALMRTAKLCLEAEKASGTPVDTSTDTAARLFFAINRRWSSIRVCRMMTNVIVAAMHLNYLLQVGNIFSTDDNI
jgi:hypothetical protein